MKRHLFSDQTLLDLEKSLKAKLNPVQPDHRFITTLREKLINEPIQQPQHRTALTMLTIAGGLLFGLAVYLFGRRYFQAPSEGG